MIIVIWGLIALAILSAGIGFKALFDDESADSTAKWIANYFLFAIFLLLLAAVIKYVW